MKKKENIRMLLVTLSYIAFLLLGFFLSNGRASIYIKAYGESQQLSAIHTSTLILYTLIAALGISALLEIGYYFFLPESKGEKACVLFALPMSDVLGLCYLVNFAFSLLFLVLMSNGLIQFSVVLIVQILLLALESFLLIAPSPKSQSIPDPTGASGSDPHSLEQYSDYLRSLSEKTESPTLADILCRLADRLDRIDPTLSEGIDLLESELSAKCVTVEDAIISHDSAKVTLMAKDFESICVRVDAKLDAALYSVKGETYSEKNNEIAEGLIDEILDDFGLEEEEDLIRADRPLDTDLRFVKAVRFADPDYREILESYNTAIRQRLIQRQTDEELARQKLGSRAAKVNLIGFGLIFISMIACLLVRTTLTQRGGYLYTERSDGTIAITAYNSWYGKEITISAEIDGKKVSEIASNAFMQLSDVTEITIPDGVQRIGTQAFRDMSSLRRVHIPESVTDISGFVFKGDPAVSVYYAGSAEQWEDFFPSRTGNSDLKSTNIHFAKQSVEEEPET